MLYQQIKRCFLFRSVLAIIRHSLRGNALRRKTPALIVFFRSCSLSQFRRFGNPSKNGIYVRLPLSSCVGCLRFSPGRLNPTPLKAPSPLAFLRPQRNRYLFYGNSCLMAKLKPKLPMRQIPTPKPDAICHLANFGCDVLSAIQMSNDF